MTVELWIDDGDPWYLSPDIWVVPGNDPAGPVGIPVLNSPAYVWARVHNRGTTAVSNATVKYYWGDPSTTVTLATATLIGTSYVSLVPGETKDVLCLTPWIPSWVNNGHECLIAEAFAAADPLPQRGPTDTFGAPHDRHVAQRNISVIYASSIAIYPFVVGNAPRFYSEDITLQVRQAPIKLLGKLKKAIGLKHIPEDIGKIEEFGLRPFRCEDQVQEVGKPTHAFRLKTGHQRGMAFAIKLPKQSRAKTGALFLIEQLSGKEVVGGIGVLVLPSKKKEIK